MKISPPQFDRRRFLRPIALAAAAVVACSSRSLPAWGEPLHQSDKLVHFLIFGLLATMLYARWRRYRETLETAVTKLFCKRRVEIAGGPCVIAGDGFSRSPETDRRTPLPGRAA